MELTLQKHKLSTKATDDYKMVRAAIRGEQRAFAALHERYKTPLYNHLYKMVRNHEDAEDLTLEAFGKAFNKLDTYSPTFAFSTWLFKIAVNNCIDHIRKKRHRFLSIDQQMDADSDRDFASTIRTFALNPEEDIIRLQRLAMVRNQLSGLSLKYRHMIELRYYEELSYDEIAKELGIPLGTVKAQLFRAKEVLYGMMQKPGPAEYLETCRRA